MEYCAGNAVEYAKSRTVVQLIERTASRWPGQPAVIFRDQVLTYSELNTFSEQLAAQLQGMGVGTGDFIPLLIRNGPELPVAMLASMKLAAPFVPVDEAGPPEIQASMISALDPKVVLCSTDVHTVPSQLRSNVVEVGVPVRFAAHAPYRLEPAKLDDLAYGFYTTGSTGAPKCALNVHLGLLNRFLYMSRRFGDSSDEVVLQNSRHVFDSSLWQLLWPLTTGSRVVIPDRAGILDLDATIETISNHRVTMTDFVPSVFNMLVAMMRSRPSLATRMASLRRVLIGGEEASAAAVHAFRAMLPEVAVINTYGPTEASIGSIFHEVTDDDIESIPIGRPIDNTYAVIVDEHMEPAGPGAVGEILLGGDCLGLGYLKDPARTRACFVDNPFPDIPGPRLYRTGDLGRHGDHGLIYFVGRRDQQVKIGGVRIELPEIELVLSRHPMVDEARVILQEGSGGKWLVAFVSGNSGISSVELKTYAADHLPPSMVPRDFVVLERMPLNGNGKTDRMELARLAAARRQVNGCLSHLSDVEHVIWQAWLDLLPIPPSTPTDDFFELGGESLMAHRLALALCDTFGTAISVRDVAEAPTIARQASLVIGLAGDGRSVSGRRSDAARSDTAQLDAAQLDADAGLPADISFPDQAPAPELRNVLLTGATGFVGSQMLHDLLLHTAADVHCLVRADDACSAERRVIAGLKQYRLWREGFAGRIHAVNGDLAEPSLGLGTSDYRQLAQTVDTVVHAGAIVNLIRGYAAHRPANVTGTVEVLRFAGTGRPKHIHYTSTLSAVLDPAEDHGIPVVEGPIVPARRPEGGYSRSKWVAERLLQQAAERGAPVTIYRLGEVMPHSVTGVPGPLSLTALLVKACLKVGMCFTSPIVTDYTPVNWASRVMIAAISRGETGYFHVRYPQAVALNDLLTELRREFALPEVPYVKFWQGVRALADEEPDDHELLCALTLIPQGDDRNDPELVASLVGLFQDGAARSYASNTDRLMAEAGIGWPQIGPDVFRRCAIYHRRSYQALRVTASRVALP